MAEAVMWPLLGLLLLSALTTGASSQDNEERLIGWRGETYQPKNIQENNGDEPGSSEKRPWVQVLSWKPRAFVYHNFLTDDEARHILQLAGPQMKRSTVVGANNTGVVDSIRTSAGTFLRRNQSPIISAIEERLAVWTNLPPSHQEDMQVLRYGPTNKYGSHMDGLNRVATVLMYLVAPDEGGETAFTTSEWLHPEVGKQQGKFSSCVNPGSVAFKPKRGDALLFYDVKPDYKSADSHSMHTGCPVVKGVKWNAVKWIHGIPFREDEYKESLSAPYAPLPDPGDCVDLEKRCKMWAESGECERNPGYMLGSSSGQGTCRKSCKSCEECAKGDAECRARNRKTAGYLVFDHKETKGLLD